MIPYKNLSGQSNINAYVFTSDSIVVQFRNGTTTIYRYTYASAGSWAVEHMKSLATQGWGLNSYISTQRPPYATKGSSLASV